ncbi:hypothetical protein [Reyranella sp.]|uniref:hypothetical protein n=1 Tax=Reyranella sp. TaxID=1929291 RepID=UPI003784061C
MTPPYSALDRAVQGPHTSGMGLLLKIILFGVAVYAAWKTFSRWKELWDRFVGRPEDPNIPRQPGPAPTQPPPTQPQPARQQARVIDASTPCRVCGAYLSAAATKCGRPDCPLPEGR